MAADEAERLYRAGVRVLPVLLFVRKDLFRRFFSARDI